MPRPTFSTIGTKYVCRDQEYVRSEQQEDVCRRKGEQEVHREKEDSDGSNHEIGVEIESVR